VLSRAQLSREIFACLAASSCPGASASTSQIKMPFNRAKKHVQLITRSRALQVFLHH
jgi:hypothetical protein